MIKLTFPNYPLFEEITKALNSQKIYFQIEEQTCYLIRSGTKQLQRIKLGNLSNTKANNYLHWIKEVFPKEAHD